MIGCQCGKATHKYLVMTLHKTWGRRVNVQPEKGGAAGHLIQARPGYDSHTPEKRVVQTREWRDLLA
jgi:hypothetical protein